MIILDKPFVSDFLKNTISENHISVLNIPVLDELGLDNNMELISENDAIESIKANPHLKIYTNSENSIAWISKNLAFSEIPSKINLFKDKLLFRDLVSVLFPWFYFRSVCIENIDELRIRMIPKPFIIKPAIGFFSMAVYMVNCDEEWENVKIKIKDEIKRVKDIYPKEVMDTGKFIIEQIIEGDEYAIDAYFNDEGQVVITNIMHHVFASGSDFSDRLYITSEKIIRDKLNDFEKFLQKIGFLAHLKNFPLHVEVRVNQDGQILPIEVNPMRFGAWCTTADATWYAYGFNSIAAFFANKKPDWEKILPARKGKTFAMMVLENSTGYKAEQIKAFNYDKLLSEIEKPLDMRKINFNKYPVFGFLFTETRDENYIELEKILKSDLRQYIELSSL